MSGTEASPAGGRQEGSTVDLANASATVEAASILTTPGIAVPTNPNESSTEQIQTQTITVATDQGQAVTQAPPPAAVAAGVPAQVINVQDATVLAAQAMVQAQAQAHNQNQNQTPTPVPTNEVQTTAATAQVQVQMQPVPVPVPMQVPIQLPPPVLQQPQAANTDTWATMALQVQGNLREWKRFTSFVDLQRRIGKLPPSEHYLSTSNIELYVKMVQMGANPGTPTIPSNLPPTFCQLLEEHLEHGLENFRLGKKTHWQRNQRIAYSNRSYLYDCIAKRAVALVQIEGGEAETLKAAAKAMDEERGDKTVAAYMKDLKAADKTIVRRKRKEKVTTAKELEEERARKRTAAQVQETSKEEEVTAVAVAAAAAASIDASAGTAIPNNAMPTLDAPSAGNGTTETTATPKLEVLENIINI